MNMKESEQISISDSSTNDEIDLIELFGVLWGAKKLIFSITLIAAICSLVISLMLSNYYRSESVLLAAEAQEFSAFSRYAGLASIAGVGLPSSGGDGVSEVMELIKSREFVKHLLTFENVLPSIMAAKSFDRASLELYFDPKIYDVETKTWTRKPKRNRGSKPSYLEVHEKYLDNILSISQDKKNGLVSITVEHISPIFAKEFLTLVIKEANTLKREKDIGTSSEALGYLKKELSNTSFQEMKESISQLIEAQLETQMMAKVNEEYSLVIIEPPFIPEKKSKPNRKIICFLGVMFGAILGTIIVLVRHYVLGKESIDSKPV